MVSSLVRIYTQVFLLAIALSNFIGHVVPEAQVGGPIALVHDGDRIVVDAHTRTIDWQVDEETKAKRLKEWHAVEHPLKAKRGVLYRYARDVAVSSNYTNKKWLL